MLLSGQDLFSSILMAAGVVIICGGLLLFYTCYKAIKGTLKVNFLAGVRLKKAFESEELWYKINKYGAWRMIVSSIIIVVCGLALVYYRDTYPLLLFILPVVVVISILVPVVMVIRYADQIQA